MGVAQSTASRLIARAQAAGTVTHQADAGDARRFTVRITDRGERLAAAGLGFRFKKLALATSDWSDADRTRFAELLHRFTASMEGTK